MGASPSVWWSALRYYGGAAAMGAALAVSGLFWHDWRFWLPMLVATAWAKACEYATPTSGGAA